MTGVMRPNAEYPILTPNEVCMIIRHPQVVNGFILGKEKGTGTLILAWQGFISKGARPLFRLSVGLA